MWFPGGVTIFPSTTEPRDSIFMFIDVPKGVLNASIDHNPTENDNNP